MLKFREFIESTTLSTLCLHLPEQVGLEPDHFPFLQTMVLWPNNVNEELHLNETTAPLR